MSRLAFALAVIHLLGACERAKSQPQNAAWSPDAGEAGEANLYPSRRCGECHGRQRDEWVGSAHARSVSEAYLVAVGQTAAEGQKACRGCHAPLQSAGPRIESDGVGCDACHTATGGSPGGPLVLSPELATRFGPYRDAKDHHFHKMAYSGFLDSDGMCAVCHQDAPGAAFGVYTTVAETKADPNAPDCAVCHMPAFKAVAAKGEKERVVAHHAFGADRKRALSEAISLKVLVSSTEAAVLLTNTGASHALPTGRPERRIRLEVEWLGKAGEKLGTEERVYGRILGGADGKLKVSFQATLQLADQRLVRGQPRREVFLAPRLAGRVVVRLWYQPFDQALQSFFGASESLLIVERAEAL